MERVAEGWKDSQTSELYQYPVDVETGGMVAAPLPTRIGSNISSASLQPAFTCRI